MGDALLLSRRCHSVCGFSSDVFSSTELSSMDFMDHDKGHQQNILNSHRALSNFFSTQTCCGNLENIGGRSQPGLEYIRLSAGPGDEESPLPGETKPQTQERDHQSGYRAPCSGMFAKQTDRQTKIRTKVGRTLGHITT